MNTISADAAAAMLEDRDRLDRATRRVIARAWPDGLPNMDFWADSAKEDLAKAVQREYEYLRNAEACGAMMKRMGEEDEARRIAAMFAPVHRTLDQLESRYEELKALPHIGCDP